LKYTYDDRISTLKDILKSTCQVIWHINGHVFQLHLQQVC